MDIDLATLKAKKTTRELLRFGILSIDKPAAVTSFKAVQTVSAWLRVAKAGHFGTLDPLATGVLPVALERAVRLTPWFMRKDKTYRVVMRLHRDVPQEELQRHMKDFVGDITQLPPVRSRVKREQRQRHVYAFETLERHERDVTCVVRCEAGTYVRKLVHDLGRRIGGAHMAWLRRTQAGPFRDSDPWFASPLELERAAEAYRNGDDEALRAFIVPAEIIAKVLPVLQVRDEAVGPLLAGRALLSGDLSVMSNAETGADCAVFCADRFVEIARVVNEGDVLARPRFVLTPDA